MKKEGWGGGGNRVLKFTQGSGDVMTVKGSGKTLGVSIGPGLPKSTSEFILTDRPLLYIKSGLHRYSPGTYICTGSLGLKCTICYILKGLVPEKGLTLATFHRILVWAITIEVKVTVLLLGLHQACIGLRPLDRHPALQVWTYKHCHLNVSSYLK